MSRARRIAALAVSVVAACAAWAPASAVAAPTGCAAALFTPTDGDAYVVEQPKSAQGAIFCDTSGSLRFSVGTAPAHGMLTALEPNGTGGAEFGYVPNLGYTGADAFVLVVASSDGATVEVPVAVEVRAATNDPPSCTARLFAPREGGDYVVEAGTPAEGHIDCFDDEGDPLTFVVSEPPTAGTLEGLSADGESSASFRYVPGATPGTDRFAVTASDGTSMSEPMRIDVRIIDAVDDPPTCTADLATPTGPSEAFEVQQGRSVAALILCADDEDGPLAFTVSDPPAHGTLAPLVARGAQGVETSYTPAEGYEGFDRFQVEVADGTNAPTLVTVRIRVVPARHDPPRCTVAVDAARVAGRYRVERARSFSGRLDCAADTGTLVYTVAAAPAHGTLSAIGPEGRFTFTAAGDYDGPDTFSLGASDGTKAAEPVAVPVQITAAVNDPPVCELALFTGAGPDGSYGVSRGRATPGRVICTDDEDDDIAFAITVAPGHGALSALQKDSRGSASFTYTPAAGYLGADAFTLAADDGTNGAQTSAVRVTVVEPSPTAPRCIGRLHTPRVGDDYEVESGEVVQGTLVCFDADGDPMTFSVLDPPTSGTLGDLVPGTSGSLRFTYTANAVTGSDHFEIGASDGALGSNPVAFDVSLVTPYDAPPECSASLFSTPLENGSYSAEDARPNAGVVSCVDDEGDPLRFEVETAPRHGAITGLAAEGQFASFDYVATRGFTGSDSARLRVSDPAGGQDVVPLDLEVGPSPNTAPVCSATLEAPLVRGFYEIAAAKSANGRLTCRDAEADAVTITVSRQPSLGVLGPLAGDGADRTFTFTAANGPGGEDRFVLRAVDALGTASETNVPVRVGRQIVPDPVPEDPAPVAPGADGPGLVAPVPTPPASGGAGNPPANPTAPGSPVLPGVTPPGPSARPPSQLSLARRSRTISVSSRGALEIALKCSRGDGACVGKARIAMSVTTKTKRTVRLGGKTSTRTVVRKRTVTLAATRYTVKAGGQSGLKLKLTSAGRKLLRTARGRELKVVLALVPSSSIAGRATTKATLKLREAKARTKQTAKRR